MPSSLAGLFFGSASAQLMSRIDTMRAAEASLVSFARRFAVNQDDNHEITVFDTRIPRSVVPLAQQGGRGCRLYPSGGGGGGGCDADGDGEGEDDSLILHGVRVRSLSGDGEDGTGTGTGSSPPPLVLLHGYANGALYFYRNLLGLCSPRAFRTVYALDMLGWGLSSRPTFQLKGEDAACPIETAESFFVESLEAWRREQRIDRMVLGGHSMGGYLGVAYCERYPERVERLILLSPVGVPHMEDEHVLADGAPLRFRLMFNLAKAMWKRGITPGSFVRTLPEGRGRKMVENYISGRLPAITHEDEKTVLAEYLYTNAVLPPSGEYCLNRLLKPVAYARKPTVYRIPKLGVDRVSFVYGERDWMDPVSGGLEVQRACDEIIRERGTGSAPIVEVAAVRDAGHLLMLENWEGFNDAVLGAAGMLRGAEEEERFGRPRQSRQQGGSEDSMQAEGGGGPSAGTLSQVRKETNDLVSVEAS